MKPSTFTFNVTATHGFNDWFAGQLHGNYGVVSTLIPLN